MRPAARSRARPRSCRPENRIRLRSSTSMVSQEATEQRRCLLALLQRGHQRHADVAFAVLAQIRAGSDYDSAVEQALRELLRCLSGRYRDPEEEGRFASGDAQPGALERHGDDLSLGAVALARPLDVRLVTPGFDRSQLDELLGGRAESGAEQSESAYHLMVGRDEAGAIAGHRGALAERVEDDDDSPVGD